MAEKMRILVPLVIEVDPQAWANADGTTGVWKEGGYVAKGVRQSVREYVLYRVQDAALIEETDATVSLK